jgi:hypothetical protein
VATARPRRGAGRCPDLLDRDDLWRFLVVLTARKAVNRVKHEQTAKRGGGDVRNFIDLPAPAEDDPALPALLSREPDPEAAAPGNAILQGRGRVV